MEWVEAWRGGGRARGAAARTVDAARLEVDEQKVVVGAAGDERVAARRHRLGERLRVREHLLLVRLELGGRRLLERGGERRDGVVVRPALEEEDRGGPSKNCARIAPELRQNCARIAQELRAWRPGKTDWLIGPSRLYMISFPFLSTFCTPLR